MHAIKDKPVVLNGQIVIRPIMVVALTYDHRLLDGREAVTFLGEFYESLLSPLVVLWSAIGCMRLAVLPGAMDIMPYAISRGGLCSKLVGRRICIVAFHWRVTRQDDCECMVVRFPG